MNQFFLPRRLLAVVFSALLGVVALSAIAAGPASAAVTPAFKVAHTSDSTMTIFDDEDWPSWDEVDSFGLGNQPPKYVTAANPMVTHSFTKCGGDEVVVKVSLRYEWVSIYFVKVTAKSVLYEGDDCNTTDRDGDSDSKVTYIANGQTANISVDVRNDQEGGDSADVDLSLYATSVLI